MSSLAPSLSTEEIRQEISRIFRKPRNSDLVALFGRGQSGQLSAMGRHWEVVPTLCELELRAAMPRPGEKTPKVFLVDWTDRPLPLDLACRIAGDRVHTISRDSRLASLFGAREVEPGLMGTGLAAVLLGGEFEDIPKATSPRVTIDEAYRGFLRLAFGMSAAGVLDLGLLAAWCLDDEHGPNFSKRCDESADWNKLRGELRAYVEKQGGALAGLVWRAWEQGFGSRFLQAAVLAEAHKRLADPVAEGLLQGVMPTLAPGFGDALLAVDKGALDGMLSNLVPKVPLGPRRQLLTEADALVPQESFLPTRAVSRWLPSGHSARETALASALQAIASDSSYAKYSDALSALESLEEHALDEPMRNQDQRDTRRLAVRLASYLVSRATRPTPAAGASYEPALRLAQDYAVEGGYVDWCRGRLRAPLPFGQDLNDAIHGVLRASDSQRREDNKRFATALLKWVEAGRPATDIVPIHSASRQFATDLVSQETGRRVLVILMDGMSWVTAVQLLERLEGENWEPILWRPKRHEGRAHFPAVIADLPTVTNVSRAAFFSGKRELRAGDKSTASDMKRWLENKALISANSGEPLPELILRNQLMDGEALHESVRKAIDSKSSVVGVVVNAIDEDLKGSSQVARDYSNTNIKPLSGLLTAAAGAERVVLLASDHGHVLGDGMKTHKQGSSFNMEGGKRWRAVHEGHTTQAFELELPTECWKPAGSTKSLAIWDEQVSHGHPNYGEHGGLSLPEVVAPAILIAPEWLSRAQGEEDAGLRTGAFPRPDWWELDLRPPPSISTQAVRKSKKKAAVPDTQLRLIPGAPAQQSAAPQEPVQGPPRLVVALRKSKIFQAQVEGQIQADIDKALEWLSVLAIAGGVMSDREFAKGCKSRPHRVPGLVARMGLLNCDGYPMVEHNRTAQQVVLHRDRLIQQFGLKL
ncbi:BREX-2 system phosphatase PglZ [Myxococcota bacterium]